MPVVAINPAWRRFVLLALCLSVLVGCPAEPPPVVEPPLPLERVPAEYWVEAEGTVSVGGVTVPGRVRMHYAVFWDVSVVVPTLVVWMHDTDLLLTFLWWEVDTEPLRCTSFRNDGALTATLAGDTLEIAAGAKLTGVSHTERDPSGECVGKARRLEVETPVVVSAVHDPDNNHFALSATFDTTASAGDDGSSGGVFSLIPSFDAPDLENMVTVSVQMEGQYLNRPPLAVLAALGNDLEPSDDGCPVTRPEGDPPMVLANTDGGLVVTLHSQSHDPDGGWPQDAPDPKLRRVDLEFEQWSSSKGEGYRFLGAGQEIGPVLFDNDLVHQLVLRVTDRWGAEGRQVCRFRVQANPGN